MNLARSILKIAIALPIVTCSALRADAVLSSVLPHLNDWRAERQAPLQKALQAGADVPLFAAFPALREHIPHIKLGTLPTPVRRMEKLGEQLNHPSLYVKEDSKAGSAFGGNKIRKLEFLLADALQHGARCVLTEGGAGSNHTTATIACAQNLGLTCHAFLSPQKATGYLRRNLLLSQFHEGIVHCTESAECRQYTLLKEFAQQRLTSGALPYYIPSGGSNEIGALGFVSAACELQQQIKAGLLPEPDYLFVAAGSNGTAAGLALGCLLLGLKTEVIAVKTTSQAEGDMEYAIVNLMVKTLSTLMKSIPDIYRGNIPAPLVMHGYFGSGYAAINEETAAAMTLARETEDLVLDGTYAGKAFAAFVDLVRSQPEAVRGKTLLFWNTFHGASHQEETLQVDYHMLPEAFHHYFTDSLQEGDITFA